MAIKILHTVESYYPAMGGMQEVVKQLSERLAALGHDVTVATKFHPDRKSDTLNGVKIKSFKVSGNVVRGLEGDVDSYQSFLLNSEFDIVTNFAAQQWATDIALPILDKIKGKKVSVPTGFSGFYWPEYQQYFENMKSWMKQYDLNVFLSDDYRDINFARDNAITKNIIIPNGAAEDEFSVQPRVDIRKKLGIPADAFLLLHVGSYSGVKGQAEACKIFLQSKEKNVYLLLVGNSNEIFEQRYWRKVQLPMLLKAPWGKKKKIKITHDLTREETVAAYHAADLFLFPSNIECSPIVLFECMAAKTPFLTTDVGNSKEIIAWSNAGLLLPTSIDERGFSHADISKSTLMLDDLIRNKQKREELIANGFQAWKTKFTWEVIAKKYEESYLNLLKQ